MISRIRIGGKGMGSGFCLYESDRDRYGNRDPSGYRKFITYPSEYLMKTFGCYMPSVDLIDMYLRLSDKYGMKFFFGLYDSGKYWDTGDLTWEIESNKYVIEEVRKKYGHHKKFPRMVSLPGRSAKVHQGGDRGIQQFRQELAVQGVSQAVCRLSSLLGLTERKLSLLLEET